MTADLQQQVQDAIDRQVDSGVERGVQLREVKAVVS